MDKDSLISMLRDFKQNHAKQYGISALGLFGSFARGQNRENSDVDIWVETLSPNPYILAHIQEDVARLVSRRVDIVRVREKMNPFLKNRIKMEGIYV
jgi:predicted nucleotidyltransferase